MVAGKLGEKMRSLGWAYILGLFLQVRIDDRSVLVPLFAGWIAVQLVGLREYRALSDTGWFTLAWGSAAFVAVVGAVGWLPAVEPGAVAVAIALGLAVGSAGYAGALQQWCLRHGWDDAATVARSAKQWMLAVAAITAVAVGTLLVFVAAGEPDPGSGFSPSVVFGRPLEGAGAWAGVLAIFVVWIGATIQLRKMSQLIRARLRRQPDLVLTAS